MSDGRFTPRHGMTRSPEFSTWEHMKARCYNPRNHRYKWYGGRGIGVCERWRDDFAAFFADVGPRPSPDHTIDRIDNDRGYEPGNVRWLTRAEQARNRSDNRFVEFRGERLCVSEWARRMGVTRGTMRWRLDNGWPLEAALTTPAGPGCRRPRLIAFSGEAHSIAGWASVIGVPQDRLKWRLRRGWTLAQALGKEPRP